jgi:hypothetical protein
MFASIKMMTESHRYWVHTTWIAAACAIGNPGGVGQIKLRDYTEPPNRSYFAF